MTLPTLLPPIADFEAFTLQRVQLIRDLREKSLIPLPKPVKTTKGTSAKDPTKALKAMIPQGLDPATQAMILQALQKRRS